MPIAKDDIISYREMCDAEKVQNLQRGMNYRLNPAYSVILMSQRSSAPYQDKIHPDGVTIEYEGHDVPKRGPEHNPKTEDQEYVLPSGKLTQNGKFAQAVDFYKRAEQSPELIKVYEKITSGVWSFKGFFELIDYRVTNDGKRNVFRFILRISDKTPLPVQKDAQISHDRIIPSNVKRKVWQRDAGQCVLCGATENLHFDHDLPYSKGGTSLSERNIRLLCMKHNLEKSAKIE